MNEDKKIVVVDSLMGTGKTSFAIQMMNEHPEMSYIYCTPFLEEVKRIKDECPNLNFSAPSYADGRKIDSFNKLIMNGENVVLTHSTFANANEQTVEYLRNSNYVLIMDETLTTLEKFNDICSESAQRVWKKDIKMLIDNFITVDDMGQVRWTAESYKGGKFTDVERMANNGTLFLIDGSLLVWTFPAYIFDLFRGVLVLTYMFEGSIMKPYFKYHNIEYVLKTIEQSNGKYYIMPYSPHKERITKCSELITVYNNVKANDYRNQSLSKTWYEKNKTLLPLLQKHLKNYFKNHMNAPSSKILWTCPKEYSKYVSGRGYSIVRKLTAEEKELSPTEKEQLERKLNCFLSCNARATNDFSERDVIAYCINGYMNPYYEKYFRKRGIQVNQDMYALSNMLQWIWRSAIRNNKPITVYIPSTRMRTLFNDWMNQ